MPNKRIELAIPVPCQQRWQDMKPENEGGFCDSCQKTVVDFTSMTDQQIGAYFSSQPKNVCGRFATSQLNRDVVLAQNFSTSALKQQWLGLIAAGLLSWSSADGQSTQLPDQNVLISERITPELPAKGASAGQKETTTAKDSTWVIEGKVIGETDKAPLPGVAIIIKGTQRGTTTDASGLFKLTLPSQDDRLVLSTGYVGYVSKEIEINLTHKLPIVISLAEDATMLTGEVIIVGTVCARKPSFFKKLKNRFRASH